tara:strand:+ start:503 stop:670 length:168 start_codon:yes stop_codon:yes gene_type:complete
MHDLRVLADQILQLKTENKLLRAASEEQRELNGQLRVTIEELKERCAGYLNGEWI